VGARKIGELVADGANFRQGYWRAEQESEGISRDGELGQNAEKLYCHAMHKTGLSGLSGLSIVCLVHLVDLVCLVHLVSFVQSNTRDGRQFEIRSSRFPELRIPTFPARL